MERFGIFEEGFGQDEGWGGRVGEAEGFEEGDQVSKEREWVAFRLGRWWR